MADVQQHSRTGQNMNGFGGCSLTIGDSRQVVRQLTANWGLRDYDHGKQIGAESSPEGYVSNLVAVFQGVRRALRDAVVPIPWWGIRRS